MIDYLLHQLVLLGIEIARLSLWLAVLCVVFLPLERLFAVHRARIWRPGAARDLGYYVLNSLVPIVLLGFPMSIVAWLVHAVVPHDVHAAAAALPPWTAILAGLVVGDVGYYWGHRASHKVPFLWRFHAIHHGAEHIDFLVNTRAHPFDMAFGRFCGLVPLYALGLSGPGTPHAGAVPLAVVLLGSIWSFFIHANLRWRYGPLEWVVSTPAFHHWHHAAEPADRNFASMLPWLDRMFGTLYTPAGQWPPAYGIPDRLPDTLAAQLIEPLLPAAAPVGANERPSQT